MKAQISLSPSPANSCTSDFPGKGTLPVPCSVPRSLAAKGLGAERWIREGLSHLICETGDGRVRRQLRSIPEVSSPCQGTRALQHQATAWEETQQHPGDTEMHKGEAEKRKVLEIHGL